MTHLGRFRMSGLTGITVAQVAALLPPVAVLTAGDPGHYLPLLGVALVATLVWETLFAILRQRAQSFHGITTALVVTVLVPVDIALWQLAIMVSFGTLLGELVFGGRGFGFLNPAVVTGALLIISFPQTQLATHPPLLAIASLPGAVLLFILGGISENGAGWREALVVLAMTASLSGMIWMRNWLKERGEL